jgi:hypothetical protein
VRSVLAAAQASIANLLQVLRPFVALFAGNQAALGFVVGAGLSTEADILAMLREHSGNLPMEPENLVHRCREAPNVEAVALGFKVDLTALNAVLAELGPPYAPVDLTERHENKLAHFLGRNGAIVQESIRAAYRSRFERGEDLTDYARARDTARPRLPDGFGLRSIELPQSQLSEWLDAWLSGLGVTLVDAAPNPRDAIGVVREDNLRYLRELARAMRVAILCRADPADPLRSKVADNPAAETALTTAATKGGWCDFDRLDEAATLDWASRCGLWPLSWPNNLGQLNVTEEERARVSEEDRRARAAALGRRRVIEYSGGAFTVGVDSLASVSAHISSLVGANAALLNTSTRTVSGVAPQSVRRQSNSDGGRGEAEHRLTDEESEVVGFFGEAIAFNWLKRRFGQKRVVDLSCWKSEYRRHVTNEHGDDYDFEVRNGGTRWFFEVKATTSETPRPRQMIELGSSEIAHAEVCRADKRMRYRILYVLDALNPDLARIFVLPNPRSRQGQTFYADAMSAGVKLIFPLPKK